MPSYSFKPRFVPYVKDYTKRQTIRKIRKHSPKLGQPLSLFTGSRFKPVRIIPVKPPITQVDTIFIYANGDVFIYENQAMDEPSANFLLENPVFHSTRQLTDSEKYLLAWNDGFRPEGALKELAEPWRIMFEWWQETHALPFAGHITKW